MNVRHVHQHFIWRVHVEDVAAGREIWQLAAQFGYYNQLFSHCSRALSRTRCSDPDE
jgi:hypothetical protein